jgi:uncharacterized protein YerC
MKRKIRELSNKEQVETLDALYTAASSLDGRDAVKLFLKDLLTTSERVMLGRRILIAQKLLAGEGSRVISHDLKVGMDTIYRVQRWLDDQQPGYEQAIREMEKTFEKRKLTPGGIDKKRYATEIMYRLKKKYPLHFLLYRVDK